MSCSELGVRIISRHYSAESIQLITAQDDPHLFVRSLSDMFQLATSALS
jgi:hypothetical protein